jgi:FlaA1/EpsC-like NDP-sugar epimerase
MIEDIYNRIWELSPGIRDKGSYNELVKLTQELIRLYDLQGRLSEDPFAPTRMRKLSLPFEEINDKLKDSVCLVTGGLWCVGSQLVQELLRFDVRSIIIYDIAQAENSGSDRITVVRGDVRDMSSLMKTMDAYKPQFVFHTAAQRNPGLAELHDAGRACYRLVNPVERHTCQR